MLALIQITATICGYNMCDMNGDLLIPSWGKDPGTVVTSDNFHYFHVHASWV